MVPSLTLCRAQESHHRRLAAETNLDNVREKATTAATAWAHEAVAAERREQRQVRTRIHGEAVAAAEAPAADADRELSENPDQGLADAHDAG